MIVVGAMLVGVIFLFALTVEKHLAMIADKLQRLDEVAYMLRKIAEQEVNPDA